MPAEEWVRPHLVRRADLVDVRFVGSPPEDDSERAALGLPVGEGSTDHVSPRGGFEKCVELGDGKKGRHVKFQVRATPFRGRATERLS